MEKKAKIIATLGPSIYNEKKLKQLVDNELMLSELILVIIRKI